MRANDRYAFLPGGGIISLSLLAVVMIMGMIMLAWRADILASHEEAMSPMVQGGLLETNTKIRFFDHSGEVLIGEIEVNGTNPARWSPLESFPAHLISAVSTLHRSELDRLSGQIMFTGIVDADRDEMATAWQIAGALLSGDEVDASDLTFFRRYFIATSLTRRYDRDFLLRWYLNTAYCGNLVFGLEPAASYYFGKSLRELSALESAGLAVAAMRHDANPRDSLEESLTLADSILGILVDDGLINPDEAARARDKGYTSQEQSSLATSGYSAFDQLAREQIASILPPERLAGESLDVYTTLDISLTNLLADSLAPGSDDMSALVFESDSGRLLAILPADAILDPVTTTPLILPFIAATAVGQGYSPASLLLDHETALQGDWSEVARYATGDSLGAVTLREALAAGRLIPGLQLANRIGDISLMRTASALGFSANTPEELLTNQISPVDGLYPLTSLASQGTLRGISDFNGTRKPVIIDRITSLTGNVLWEYSPDDGASETRVFDPSVVFLVNNILTSQEANDGGSINRQGVAFITGSTPDTLWAAGYSRRYVLGIWSQGSDAATSRSLTATWFSAMANLHGGQTPPGWEQPDSVLEVDVCELSGLLPSQVCPVITELFISGTEPVFYDTMYRSIQVNRENGLLATIYTPIDLIETRVFFDYPPEFEDWVREANIPRPPAAYDIVNMPEINEPVTISSPSAFSYQHGTIAIEGTVRDESFKVARIDYGSGLNPQQWFQIGDNIYDPVTRDTLVTWDTSGIEGLIVLRLTLIRQDNSLLEVFTQFTIDNTPPTAEIINIIPLTGEGTPAGSLRIEAYTRDNIGIDHVEFFAGDSRISLDDSPPFTADYFPEGGIQRFFLAAYDLAGNMTLSDVLEYTPTP